MKASLGAALLYPLVLAQPARAEFQIASTHLDAGAAAQAGTHPITLNPDRTVSIAANDRRPRMMATPSVPMALGFGRQVPLAFATGQIVPAGIKVTFGPKVERDGPVDWSGGRPWVDALRAAVHPLGLRVSVGWKVVSIART